MKTIHYLLTALLVMGLTGCDRLEQDKLAAPDDDQLQRYGLDNVKLGDKRADAGKQLETLLKQPLQCKTTKAGLGDQRKAYIVETCTAKAVDGQVGALWDEKLTALSAIFVENQLCQLTIQLQTSGDYHALYDKYGKKILNLFGKPDKTTTQHVQWLRHGDEVLVQNKGQGSVVVEIRNQKVMQALHHQQ